MSDVFCPFIKRSLIRWMNGGRFEKIRRPRQVPIYCMCADKRVKPTLYWNQFFCFLLKYLVHSSIDRALYIGDNSTLGKLVGVFIEKSRPGLFLSLQSVYVCSSLNRVDCCTIHIPVCYCILFMMSSILEKYVAHEISKHQESHVKFFKNPKLSKKNNFFLFPWYFFVKTWWNTNLI